MKGSNKANANDGGGKNPPSSKEENKKEDFKENFSSEFIDTSSLQKARSVSINPLAATNSKFELLCACHFLSDQRNIAKK